MKFQILSDIHLEMLKRTPVFPVLAENLILAGDIGYVGRPIWRQFLRKCVEDYKRVIYIAGNHEFYGTDYDVGLATIAKEEGVIFLEKGSLDIEEVGGEAVRILGTTLWTEIPAEKMAETQAMMSDYSQIQFKGRYLTGRDTNYMHRVAKNWLRGELEKAAVEDKKVIVVTHHLPSFQMVAAKYKQENNHGFASDCEDLVTAGPVRAWICGHSHTQMERWIGDTVCVMASVGYPSEVQRTPPHMCTLEIDKSGKVTVEWPM
jgi:predicted phosphodiesterase